MQPSLVLRQAEGKSRGDTRRIRINDIESCRNLSSTMTARQVVDDLVRQPARANGKLRRRLPEDEQPIGWRMGDLFAGAKAHRDLRWSRSSSCWSTSLRTPDGRVLILDFQAQRPPERGTSGASCARLPAAARPDHRLDMVDRAAHRVRRLPGRPRARSAAPNSPRRATRCDAARDHRPAVLHRSGSDADLAAATPSRPARRRPVPLVHNAVGIFLSTPEAGSEALHRLPANSCGLCRVGTAAWPRRS